MIGRGEMRGGALVTSEADGESLVPPRKRKPSHRPSVTPDDGYAFEDGARAELEVRGVGPLRAVPVRSEGLAIFKANPQTLELDSAAIPVSCEKSNPNGWLTIAQLWPSQCKTLCVSKS